MNIVKIVEEFDNYIQENRYSKHLFVQLLSDEKVTKRHLKNWAIQKYHQTYCQNVVFSAIHSNSMIYEDIRQFQMQQLIGEETALTDGSASHYHLMKKFALAMDASEEDIAQSKISEGVMGFVNYIVSICKKKHPVLAMLAIYVNESQTPEGVHKMYDILKKRFLLDDEALEWFIVHSQADIDHAQCAKKLICKYAHKCKNFEEEAWMIIKNGVAAWTDLQNFYATLLR